MGVSDNKTYKDMYHFSPQFYPVDKKNLPSIEADPKINTTIKKNPYASNVEIEGREIVLEPDLSALFIAKGKRHSGGGMDVFLKPDSFIFSDDKSLAFNERDHKLLELKKGGKKEYTPAEVLKKNVDIKHYNTLTSNLQDIKKDELAKRSSMMMLEKYIQTIGNVAFGQEKKKGFPQGLPEFSQGTAPVYDTDLKNDIMEQKQFAKYGGTINPKMQFAGAFNPNPFTRNTSPSVSQIENSITGYSRPPRNRKPGEWIQDPATGRWFQNKMLSNVTVPVGKYSGVPALDIPVPVFNTDSRPLMKGSPVSNIPEAPTTGNTDSIIPGSVIGQAQGVKKAEWDFTPWQKLSMGHDASKIPKRYMPYRSRFNPSYIEPSLLNPEQAIGDLKGAAYQQTQASNSLSPILRNAQNNTIYGQLLNQMPNARSQYDNQNAGIINQTRAANNQIRNNAAAENLKNDQNYYRESVVGQQNFDNMKSFLSDRFMNNVQGNVQDNQTLALKLLQQNNPAYAYDFKTGEFTRNKQDILDAQGVSSEDTFTAMIKQAKALKDAGFTPVEVSAMLRSNAFSKLAPYLGQSPTFGEMTAKKRGGKVGKNPYRY